MVSAEKAKQDLKNKGYSEVQIEEILSSLDTFATVLVESYLANKKTDKNKE